MSLWFTSAAAAALIAGAPLPPAAYVAPCPSGVSGGLPAHYERSSLLVGPLALYGVSGFARYPGRSIVPVRGSARRFPGFEQPATVAQGHSVVLAVAARDRAHVGFLFDHRAFRHAVHGYRVADGTAAVRLRGCTATCTQYQGGFVLDGPRCVTLEAWIDGDPVPVRRVVSFGSRRCATRGSA
jgi:hypothetical protein